MYEIIMYPADGTSAGPEDHREFTYYGLEIEGVAWIEEILSDPMSFDADESACGMGQFRRILDRQDRQGDVRVTDTFGDKWIFEVVEN